MGKSSKEAWVILSVVSVMLGLSTLIMIVSQQSIEAAPVAAVPEAAPSPAVVNLSPQAANGKALFETFQPVAGIACTNCHRTDSEDRLVGPGLLNVGLRAQSRVKGLTAEQYIHQSIVDPSAYIVADYPDIMPKVWGQVFTDSQLEDIISYLITLH